MTLPAVHAPLPGGLLADVLDTWRTAGWDPAALGAFRMGPDDDDDAAFEGLSEEEIDAIDSLSEDDLAALQNLKPEALALLTGGGAGVDEDDLPDPVKAVLKKNRAETRDAKKAKRAADATAASEKARADRAERELERLRKKGKGGSGGGGKDDDPDPAEAIEEARRKADEEATAKADERVVRAEVKAMAGQRFSDPSLAARLVDLKLITVDADGNVDEDAITEQLDEILEKNPGLAAKAKRHKPKPSNQGKRGTPQSGADAGRAEAERRFGKREAAGTK